jgi:hypothetical protein
MSGWRPGWAYHRQRYRGRRVPFRDASCTGYLPLGWGQCAGIAAKHFSLSVASAARPNRACVAAQEPGKTGGGTSKGQEGGITRGGQRLFWQHERSATTCAGSERDAGSALAPRLLTGQRGQLLLSLTGLEQSLPGVGAQQSIDQPRELENSQDQRPRLGVSAGPRQLRLVGGDVRPTVNQDTVGRRDQVGAWGSVAGLGQIGVMGLEGARLMDLSEQASGLG